LALSEILSLSRFLTKICGRLGTQQFLHRLFTRTPYCLSCPPFFVFQEPMAMSAV
jgi:hypothetical protein